MLKAIANSVRHDAVSTIQTSIAWTEKNDPKFEAEMKQMFNADAKDLLHVADSIEQNKIAEAASAARHMDTAARENINERAWDFIMDGE